MILNYSKWKKLFEQSTSKPYASGKPMCILTCDPDVIEVDRVFREYLISLIPEYYDLPISELHSRFRALTDQQLSGAIEFFKSKGYRQPGNPKIIKFQQALMEKTDYKKFTSASGTSSNFDDGTFGAATAKAMIQRFIDVRKKMDQTQSLRKSGALAKEGEEERERLGITKKEPVSAPKTQTGQNVELNIGTQKVQ
jgi:hypothetical protein